MVVLVQGLKGLAFSVLVALSLRFAQVGQEFVVVVKALLVASLLRHAAIKKHELCSLVGAPLAVDFGNALRCDVELSSLLFALQARGNDPCVKRNLLGGVHEAEPCSIPYGYWFEVLKPLEPGDNALDDLFLCRGRLDVDANAATTLDPRNGKFSPGVVLAIPPLDVLVRNAVGERVVQVHEGAHVGPVATETVHLLETPARFGGLELGGGVNELRSPGVEMLHPHVGEVFGRQVAHHGVHLHGAVADRGAGHERDRPVCLAQRSDLGPQVVSLGRSCPRVHAPGLHVGRVEEVLELVRLVHG